MADSGSTLEMIGRYWDTPVRHQPKYIFRFRKDLLRNAPWIQSCFRKAGRRAMIRMTFQSGLKEKEKQFVAFKQQFGYYI